MNALKIHSEGDWFRIAVCENCENTLGEHQRMHSDGVCPKCGYDSRSSVCDTHNIVLKKVYIEPVWKFWTDNVRYVGKSSKDDSWLLGQKVYKRFVGETFL